VNVELQALGAAAVEPAIEGRRARAGLLVAVLLDVPGCLAAAVPYEPRGEECRLRRSRIASLA
jgi:hypothetical protein